MEPRSPALQVDSLPVEPQGNAKNTGVSSLSLLQGIFLTQEWNRGLLNCRWILEPSPIPASSTPASGVDPLSSNSLVSVGSSFILLQVVGQFSQHHLLKRLSLLHCIFLPLLSKIRCYVLLLLIQVLLLLSRLSLCDPIDGSPSGSAVPGILQARTLEWVTMPSSRGSSLLRDQTWVPLITGRFFTS